MPKRLILITACLALLALTVYAWAPAARTGEETGPAGEVIHIDPEGRADLPLPDVCTYPTWYAGGTTVTFDHAMHVDELELACSQCHHLELCDRCHLKQAIKTVIRDSRGALHSACFRCHEQDPGEGSCADCHVPDETGAPAGGVSASVQLGRETHEEILQAMDTDVETIEFIGERFPLKSATGEPPEGHLFVTTHNGMSTVGFPHALHADDHGLSCGLCHHLERCDKCHGRVQRKVNVASAQTAVRDNCVNCHDDLGLPTDCEQCHTEPHTR